MNDVFISKFSKRKDTGRPFRRFTISAATAPTTTILSLLTAFTKSRKSSRFVENSGDPIKILTSKTSVLALLFILLAFSLSAHAQITTPVTQGCNNNMICDKQLSCDISTQTCTPIYSNCRGCGTSIVKCSAEKTVVAANICQESAGGAECVENPRACTQGSLSINEPNVVLKFNVFTAKDIVITVDPPSVTTLPGTEMNYRLSVENKNPTKLVFTLAYEAPEGWIVNIADQISVDGNRKKETQFSVKSKDTATNNAYKIKIILIEPTLSLFLSKDAEYVIGERGAPILDINPRFQEGLPGQMLTYTVTVKNNDPAGFDSSTIFLRPVVPAGWQGRLSDTSVTLSPGETATATLDVISSLNATGSELVGVNATSNTLASVIFAEYQLNFCGDGVCSIGEASTCVQDCPNDPIFSCKLAGGRCEQETDIGVHFSSDVSMLVNKFVICNKRFTQQQCEAAFDSRTCGIDNACLCGDRLGETQCNIRCVDNRGFYFLYARGGTVTARSIANYTFTCPFVDLQSLIALKGDFEDSLENFEQAYSGLLETVNQGNDDTKAKFQPCLDAHSKIINDINSHISYMDKVIASPAKSNTTDARQRSVTLKNNIEHLINEFCALGVTGLLKIENFVAPDLVEIGSTMTTTFTVKNVGTISYYGFVSCDFTLGSSKKQANTTCRPLNPGDSFTDSVTAQPDSVGTWSASCKSYGSFNQDCSDHSVHSIRTASFDTYTKNVNVVDVTTSCTASGIQCVVRTNSPQDCAACRIELGSTTSECIKTGKNGTRTFFDCGERMGVTNLTGYVTPGENCNPVPPTKKNASAYCPGCGSGRIDQGETCEPPGTDNNPFVKQQASLTCEGKRALFRDAFGFCTPTCEASIDQPRSVCIKNSCLAQCGEGETKTVVVTEGFGSCRATQQCGEECDFLNATCEPRLPGVNRTTSRNGTIFLSTEHFPGNITTNTTVRITGFTDASNVRIDIFLDGALVKTCSVAQCDYFAKINRTGIHNYYATLLTGNITVRDPAAGSKSFVVFPDTGVTRLCDAALLSASCSYDAARNIYNVSASARWGSIIGDHAHIKIAGDTGLKKLYTAQISTSRLVGPGTHEVAVEVHDFSDNVVCADEQNVLCGLGNSTGRKVSVLRELADVVPAGDVPVRIRILANDDVSLKLIEHVPTGLAVKDIRLSNSTINPSVTRNVVIDEVTYDAYSWTRELKKSDIVQFTYTITLPDEKEYKFTSIAEYDGEQKKESFTTFATKCPQIGKVYATSPSGTCQSFRTSCEIFPGWSIVDECPSIGLEEEEEFQLISLVPFIVIVIILGLAFVYRHRIKEKLSEWRAGGIVKKMRKAENQF